MSGNNLNTLLVQRVEAALGVPLSQHVQIATAGRQNTVTASATATPTDSSTERQKLPKKLQAHRTAGAARDAENITHADRRAATVAAPVRAATAAQAVAPPASAPTQLSQLGKILLPLFQSSPGTSATLNGTQTLFVGAVMTLRADMAAASALASVSEKLKTTAAEVPLRQAHASAPGAALAGALFKHLRHVINDSGLFYESHLLKQLQATSNRLTRLTEPQGQRAPVCSDAGESDSSMDVPEALRPIVRQQLDLLAGQPLQWQGMAWPDAPMHWSITPPQRQQDDEDTQSSSHERDAGAWSTTLKLTLTGMGEIEALITLGRTDVLVKFFVGERGAAIEQHIHQFRAKLIGAGLDAESITVTATRRSDNAPAVSIEDV